MKVFAVTYCSRNAAVYEMGMESDKQCVLSTPSIHLTPRPLSSISKCANGDDRGARAGGSAFH